MSQDQQNIIAKLLRVIEESEAVESMPFSTSKELKALVRELQVA